MQHKLHFIHILGFTGRWQQKSHKWIIIDVRKDKNEKRTSLIFFLLAYRQLFYLILHPVIWANQGVWCWMVGKEE